MDDNATTDEDTAVDIDAAGNDSDVEGDALTVTAVSDPPKGTASVNQNGTVHYLPDPDFNGTDTFAYTIQDPSGASATGTVTVTVNPVNDPPLLAAIGDQQLSEGDVVDVDVSATDPDGTTPSLSASGLPAFANLIDNGNGTGVIQLAPGLGEPGDYPATITATDDVGLTDVETFTISVVPAGAGSDLACLTGSDLVTIGRDADVMCDILSGGKFRLYHGSRAASRPGGCFHHRPGRRFHPEIQPHHRGRDAGRPAQAAARSLRAHSRNRRGSHRVRRRARRWCCRRCTWQWSRTGRTGSTCGMGSR